MNLSYLIPVILVIAGICFMVFMNKKHKALKTEINLDAERAHYEVYKEELLKNDFSHLKQWMKGRTIDAFTMGSVPQSTKSKVQEVVTDGVANVALSAIGVKLKRIDTDCFWVLSENELHFLSTDSVGELSEHIIFDNFRIEEAVLHYGGILKSQLGFYAKASEEYLPKVHVITFNIDGSPLALEIHDRLNYIPDPTDVFDLRKQLNSRAKYQVVGERFLAVLQAKFPNLKVI